MGDQEQYVARQCSPMQLGFLKADTAERTDKRHPLASTFPQPVSHLGNIEKQLSSLPRFFIHVPFHYD